MASILFFQQYNSPGRTGHDYANKLIGYELEWYSKNTHDLNTKAVQKLINAGDNRYIFTRQESTSKYFTYQGHGLVKKSFDQKPAKIIWDFSPISIKPSVYPDDLLDNSNEYFEGEKKTVLINTYERNPAARKVCIVKYGAICFICGFDFGKVYGDECEGLIHVHHLRMVSKNDGEYILNPIDDLRPVCPNCHMVLHSKKEGYTIEEVKNMLKPI